ncbi:50S ribosomal protein L33 [Candidatus Peregrinibacteria bacterium CG08_land_8_20_14_0_20_41_10]|nr:MAG: 50S ribosomal protein L33 [Candidatus Peregrinibacteria bacterium CG1_02_41_10]PIS32111.1 MAG: 50S ribosomal protein L33 [Candidatus Peregrinibacteria bacterium CG08_land_8_20_14_0_20_41_10]
MAKKGKSVNTSMYCPVCNRHNYLTARNKQTHAHLDLNKYCPQCRKHTLHKGKDTKN